jgi:hypothetical protein
MLYDDHGGKFPASAYEFRSRASLFGLPLVHVRLGDRFDVIRGPVKAWIAVGSSHSIGVIFASGVIAVAPISFGGIAIGFLSFGAISIGTLALGAIALGGWAYGGAALGWDAFCGFGAGLHAVMGGMAFAGDFGVGTLVYAAQANTDAATQFIQGNWFFQSAQWLNRHGILVQLIWIIPVMLQARIVGRARRERAQAAS